MLAQVLQDDRREHTDHACVHAQGAKGIVQVIGIFDLQGAVQGRAGAVVLAQQRAQPAHAGQGIHARKHIEAGHGFAQFGVVGSAQLILGQAQQGAGTADGLFGSDLEIGAQGIEQVGRPRRGRHRRGFVLAIVLHGRNRVGGITEVEGEHWARSQGHQRCQGKTTGNLHRNDLISH
ncbi:hypothetical protein D9M73_167740 [compost metagenome]